MVTGKTVGYTNDAFVGNDAFSSNHNLRKSFENGKRQLYQTEVIRPVEIDDYDPYKHREVEHPTKVYETVFHLLKGTIGTGILSMPNAMKNSGYITGAIVTISIGMICTYCIQMLIRSEYELCKRKKVSSMTYPQVAQAAFSEGPDWVRKYMMPYIAFIVNIFILVFQLGLCCVYNIFISANIKSVVDFYIETPIDLKIYMFAILIPLILINWVRNLKYLAPFSVFGSIVTVISFAIIGYYVFRESVTIADKNAFGELKNFPLFFGTVLFSLEVIGMVLPLENEMKSPKNFTGKFGVLNISMGVAVFLYFGLGFFGYLKYGSDVKGTITLNLPANEILAQTVKIMLALAIYITHGIALYIAIDIVWNTYVSKRFHISSKSIIYEYIVRTGLVLITFFLAILIPNIELFISFFGALCVSIIGLALPAVIDICTFWYKKNGWSKFWLIFSNLLISIVGLIGLIIGTYTSVIEIGKTLF